MKDKHAKKIVKKGVPTFSSGDSIPRQSNPTNRGCTDRKKMISDFTILGIPETEDITIIKRAFRARVKELHPDVADATVEITNHYKFVAVCNAYERITTNKKANIKNTPSGISQRAFEGGILQHKDPSYAYYKTACKYYELVHPSHWNVDQSITINGKTNDEKTLQKETLSRVKELVSLFPKAYYYFSVVVHEYPESVWVHDSREKMEIIEKRMVRYRKIIESFITWNDSMKSIDK